MDKYLANEKIKSDEVMVIDQDGKQIGVMSLKDAIDKAKEDGLDLIQVSNSKPPACKIADYGKLKYETRLKDKENRKKNKVVIKQITMKLNISDHDLQTKINHAQEFLTKNQKVQFIIKLKGREVTHKEIPMNLVDKIKTMLGENYKIEKEPNFNDKHIMMLVVPDNK